jgi:hypothetical protein
MAAAPANGKRPTTRTATASDTLAEVRALECASAVLGRYRNPRLCVRVDLCSRTKARTDGDEAAAGKPHERGINVAVRRR